LGDFIKAMGGRLEIRAVFPDGVVTIEKVATALRLLEIWFSPEKPIAVGAFKGRS